MSNTKQPIQPLYTDGHGTTRFRENKVVRYLLDHGGIDMNDLARISFPNEDREQFAQLIGYSLSGFGELSYVSDETYDAAAASVEGADLPVVRAECGEQTMEISDERRKALEEGFRSGLSESARILRLLSAELTKEPVGPDVTAALESAAEIALESAAEMLERTSIMKPEITLRRLSE